MYRRHILGEGAYGKVYRERTQHGAREAIKEMDAQYDRGDVPPSCIKELSTHVELVGGPGILDILWYKLTPKKLFVAYPVYDTDVWKYTFTHRVSFAQTRSILEQVLNAVSYMHGAGFVHMDIKPNNILYDPRTGDTRLCDFGISERIDVFQERRDPSDVQTLWYRAPEVMLGETRRTPAMDVWSIGGVMIDLLISMLGGNYKLAPLRSVEEHTVDAQLRSYFTTLGAPTVTPPPGDLLLSRRLYWPEMDTYALARPDMRASWPHVHPLSFADVFPCAPPECVTFLEDVFVYRPSARPTARALLEVSPLFMRSDTTPEESAPYVHTPSDSCTADDSSDDENVIDLTREDDSPITQGSPPHKRACIRAGRHFQGAVPCVHITLSK